MGHQIKALDDATWKEATVEHRIRWLKNHISFELARRDSYYYPVTAKGAKRIDKLVAKYRKRLDAIYRRRPDLSDQAKRDGAVTWNG